jgi:Tfp pilus assembly protein PilN
MAEIELIPAAYATGRMWRRRLMRFALGLVLLAMVIAAARAWLNWRIAAERPAVAALRQGQTTANARRAALDGIRKDKQSAEARLLALQGLRDRAAWPVVFRAIDAAHHSNIWFDELDYSREARGGSPAAGAAPAAPAASGAAPALLHRFEIVGHALTHAAVTEFMRELDAQPGIGDLRLTDSGMRRYSTIDVVDFRLTGLIEPDRSAVR